MSWSPPDRPAWVQAINAGEVLPIRELADLPFDRDALLGEACARQGLAGGGVAPFCHAEFPEAEFLEPLERVLAALEDEAELNRVGRWMTRRFLLRLLEGRLQLMAYLRADPGVRDERVVAPLVVAGAPRTGTTILHALLARDPSHRAPLGWELLRPVPPPDAVGDGAAADARIGLADRELVLPQTVVSGLLAIHAYSGSAPKECLSAMSFAFRTEEFTARYRVPSYQAWLESSDPLPAYRMHRLVLQVLQRRTGPSTWVLKSPVHLHVLPSLFEVYPDAQVAITHRDPLTVLASLTSLIATLRFAHSDAVDFPSIAADHARRYRQTFANLVEWTESGVLPEAAVHHSHYADFLVEPLGVVADVYARFGRAYGPELEATLREALGGGAQAEHGAHEYSFADLGLDPHAERAALAAYQERFGVVDEATALGASGP